MSIDRITLKSLKINKTLSEETLCYSATVYLDGKPVMAASNRGQGASDDLWPIDTVPVERVAELRKLAKALFLADPTPFHPDDIKVEGGGIDLSYLDPLEIIIGRIIDNMEIEKQYKRWCKKSVVFRVEGDPEGQWRTLNRAYDPAQAESIRGRLQAKYGVGVTILNERFS